MINIFLFSYYSFMSESWSNVITDIVDKSAKIASIFWGVLTWHKFSRRKDIIATASKGNGSKESLANTKSHNNKSCSGGKCPLKALTSHFNTIRILKWITF